MEAETIVKELIARIARLEQSIEWDENRSVRKILADRQRVLKSLLKWIMKDEKEETPDPSDLLEVCRQALIFIQGVDTTPEHEAMMTYLRKAIFEAEEKEVIHG